MLKAVVERDNSTEWVLDVPVGTGRFLSLYKKLGLSCIGVDASEDMLAEAKKLPAARGQDLVVGDATAIEYDDNEFDVAICIRFLNLVDQHTMYLTMKELLRLARRQIILTIRLGEIYVPKSTCATHDEKKFRELVNRSGWKIAEDVPIFKAGWTVLRLERKTKH